MRLYDCDTLTVLAVEESVVDIVIGDMLSAVILITISSFLISCQDLLM